MILLLCLMAAAAACGPASRTSRYIKKAYLENEHYPFVYYHSSFDAMTALDKDIKLFYAGDTPPVKATKIIHGKRRARNKDCEIATLDALKTLQEDAKKIGADAIVNLKPGWEGHSMLVMGKKYFCAGGTFVFGIEWEGDLVKIQKEAGKPAKKPAKTLWEKQEDVHLDPSDTTGAGTEDILSIAVMKKGTILYSGQEVSLDQLKNILTQKFKTDPGSKILIQADEEVKHAAVVEVMDLAKSIGFQSIGLSVQGKK